MITFPDHSCLELMQHEDKKNYEQMLLVKINLSDPTGKTWNIYAQLLLVMRDDDSNKLACKLDDFSLQVFSHRS